jgi:hypothetical protein
MLTLLTKLTWPSFVGLPEPQTIIELLNEPLSLGVAIVKSPSPVLIVFFPVESPESQFMRPSLMLISFLPSIIERLLTIKPLLFVKLTTM